jgi:hypothetical protein
MSVRCELNLCVTLVQGLCFVLSVKFNAAFWGGNRLLGKIFRPMGGRKKIYIKEVTLWWTQEETRNPYRILSRQCHGQWLAQNLGKGGNVILKVMLGDGNVKLSRSEILNAGFVALWPAARNANVLIRCWWYGYLGVFTRWKAGLEVVVRTCTLISNFHNVLYVVYFLLGNSPASEFYTPTFRNTVLSS